MATRITRRPSTTKLASLCLALLLAVGLLPHAANAASDPQEVVRSFYGVLLNNMRDGRVLGQSGRYAKLAPVIESTFDILFMTRLGIWRHPAALGIARRARHD